MSRRTRDRKGTSQEKGARFIAQLSKVNFWLLSSVQESMIALEKLLSLLPPCLLEQLALEHHVDARNQVRLRGSTVFICLLNGLLNHGDLTQRLLEEIYQQHYQPQTAHRADHSSFGKRLASIKPAFFAAIYAHLHRRMAPQATAGETKALRLRWADATSVLLSAKLLSFGLLSGTRRQQGQYRAVKSVLALHEDGLPHLLHVCRDPSETGDSVALGRTMHQHSQPGDLWIFDKGVHGRQRLLDIAEAGAFFLTPHGCQGVRVGKVLWRSEEPEPSALPAEGQPAFVPLRAEQVVFENSRAGAEQRQKWAKLPLVLVHGLRFDVRAGLWKPLTLMTNLPPSTEGSQAGPYTWGQLGELYRRRWDMETLFKFLKQHLSYSHLTSRSENGIQVMIYMSLIAALLLIWYKRQTGIDRGWRSVKFWFAEDVRLWTEQALRQEFQEQQRQE